MSLIGRFLRKSKTCEKISYSQCGEDLIVDFILDAGLGIKNPSYLDLGAYDPVCLSNTYLFYRRGGSGVCVEPDPFLFAAISRKRSRDICLNIGVGLAGQSTANFYVMSSRTLNTFSKKEAERYRSYGNNKIEQVIPIPLLGVNDIIEQNFKACPNFVSIDVEGLDVDVLKSFDFSKYRPEVFCVETITYTEDNSERKVYEIMELMDSRGYFVYADTFINTIFVEKEAWKSR